MGKSLTRWLAERELRSLSRRVPERATQIDRSSVPVTVEVDETPVEVDYPVPDLLGEGVRAGQQADKAWDQSEFAKNLAEQLETELGEAQADLDQALADATTALSEAGLARSEAAEAVSDAADAVAQATQAIQDALAASVKADGVNTFSDRVPVAGDAEGKPVGAAWFVRDTGGISQVWELTSLGWVERPLEEAIIPKVAIGEGTYGDLSGGRIVAGSIVTEKLDALAVTAAKLAAEAVTSVKIAAEAVTTEKIAAGAVTANEIAALAVTAEKLAAASITAEKIAAGAITTGKLAADAIDGMTITGALVRTAETGQRFELDVSGLRGYDSNGAIVATLKPTGAGLSLVRGAYEAVRADNTALAWLNPSGVGGYALDSGTVTHAFSLATYPDRIRLISNEVPLDLEAGKGAGSEASKPIRLWNKTELHGNVFQSVLGYDGLYAWDSAPDGTRAWVTAENREYVRVNGQWVHPGDHSTTEKFTGRHWVDGKPIYSRAFTGTITRAGNSREFTNLSSGVSALVTAYGYWTGGDGNKYMTTTMYPNDARNTFYQLSSFRVISGDVQLITVSDKARTNAPYQVAIEYTKL